MPEPIIIDGVDVSGCIYSVKNTPCICDIDGKNGGYCAADKNCYYKQLQRKTQEAERYHKEWINCSAQLDWYKSHEQYMQEKHYDLTMENNQLEEKYKPLDDEYFKGLDVKTIAELAKKSIRLSRENRELENANEKLRAELEEECENSDKKETELRTQLGRNNHLYKEKLKEIKKNLLYINTEIAHIAQDKLTCHVIETALAGLNAGLADLIRKIRTK